MVADKITKKIHTFLKSREIERKCGWGEKVKSNLEEVKIEQDTIIGDKFKIEVNKFNGFLSNTKTTEKKWSDERKMNERVLEEDEGK